MEWNKENTRNTFIRFNTTKQKEKAIAFYKELEYSESKCMKVYPNYKGQEVGTVYIEWNTMIFVSRTWTPAEHRVQIHPFSKPRRKFPREMMVSDDKITWWRRCVVAKAGNMGLHIAMKSPWTIGDVCNQYKGWPYAKEINKMEELNKRLPAPIETQKEIIKKINSHKK